MRLVLLTALTMGAFAANSVLNRVGVVSGGISAEGFAALRALAGAVTLLALLRYSQGTVPLRPNPLSVAGLVAYLVGFSQAYVVLDAGWGALILFGGVQITMFFGALWRRERVTALKWSGMGLACFGLYISTGGAPAGTAAGPAIAMMTMAAVGWGVYSLIGAGGRPPVAATAANFLWATPFVASALLLSGFGPVTLFGASMAVLSGAVTSGLGYALWYRVLPRLSTSTAAVAQLTVPILAALMGAALLGEALTGRFTLAAALVLGGVALSLVPAQRRIGSSGS